MADEKKYIIPDYVPPDWSIGDLYNKSWQIIKKYKVLWLFGMAMAGAAGSGLENSRWDALIPSDSPSEETPIETEPEIISESLYQGGRVLSTSTQAGLGSQLQQLLSDIPTYLYVLGGIEIILLVLTGWAILFVYGAWANASLIEGIQTALAGGNVSIRDSSEKAFRSIKSLVWLAIVPTLILILVSLVIIGLPALGLVLGGTGVKIFSGIVLGVSIIAYIIIMIFVGLAQIWAPREVVIDKKPAKDALFAGIRIARRKFWSMLLLGLVNLILGAVIFGVLFGIPLGLAIGGALSISTGNLPLGIGLIILGGLPFLFLILISALPSGIFTAFKASVWTIAYNNIRGKYDK